MSEPRQLLPYDEARHLLGGIGKSMFFEMLKDGRLDRVKLGSRGFVTRASVDQLLVSLAADAVRRRHGAEQPYDVPLDEGNDQ